MLSGLSGKEAPKLMKLKRPTTVLIASIALVVTLASCGTSSSGVVTGKFRIVEGGVEYHNVSGTGKVILRQRSRVVRTAQVSSANAFKLSVPAGSYDVSANCKQGLSNTQQPSGLLGTPKHVTIHESHTSTVNVTCVIETTIG
jgi:hypothetical protein